MKRLLYFIFFLFLIFLFLMHPVQCITYGESGLLLWFHKMLPTLFPFMVISGIIIRLNLDSYFPSVTAYVTLIGFLCGFPMGAFTAASMYQENKITREEAQYLIAFTNNLGPSFFLSYLLPAYHQNTSPAFLFGMYGIPLLYGLILKKTVYQNVQSISCKTTAIPCELTVAINSSVTSSITAITKLGGYMILLQTFYIVPQLFMDFLKNHFFVSPHITDFLQAYLCCALELTGGISAMTAYSPFFVMILLPLGGISCILQTGSILSEAGLPLAPYLYHKTIQTLLSVLYYAFLIALGL